MASAIGVAAIMVRYCLAKCDFSVSEAKIGLDGGGALSIGVCCIVHRVELESGFKMSIDTCPVAQTTPSVWPDYKSGRSDFQDFCSRTWSQRPGWRSGKAVENGQMKI